MISLSNKDYWHDTSILRATQAWQQENKIEKKLSKEYQLFLEQIKREVADLYAQYGVEGLLNYADLQKRLTTQELSQYKSLIQGIIDDHREVLNEETLLEMNKFTQFTNLNILDARMNAVSVYALLVINKSIEMLSESLSQTFINSYYHTLYDSHRKIGFVLPFERLTKSKVIQTVLSDWSGNDFISSLKHARHTLLRDIRKTIVKGIRRNESYQKVVKNLNNLVSGGKGYKRTRNILRGETARVIAESTAQGYEQAGLKQFQFISTLDSRTTEICRHMDKKVFYLKDIEVGKNCNPMHYNCRSTVAGYFPEDDLSELERMARNRVTGENYKVSADLSYKEWHELYNK